MDKSDMEHLRVRAFEADPDTPDVDYSEVEMSIFRDMVLYGEHSHRYQPPPWIPIRRMSLDTIDRDYAPAPRGPNRDKRRGDLLNGSSLGHRGTGVTKPTRAARKAESRRKAKAGRKANRARRG
jgi:hypothetical protein